MKCALTAFAYLTALACSCQTLAANPQDTFTFKSGRNPGQTDRVVVLLEAGGETKYTDDGKPKTDKMSLTCRLDYYEKTTETSEPDMLRSVRDYQKVAAVVRVGDAQFEPALTPQHRLICAETADREVRLFSPSGNLAREELDAIDIQADSLLLDRLLPTKAVSIGDPWPLSAELMAAFLGLDEVAKTTVQCTLREVTDAVARFELEGHVEGAIYGVSTRVQVKARYRFDRRRHRVDWLGMLIKEERSPSFVADGVDVVSRLQMTIVPAAEPAGLADAALTKLARKSESDRMLLNYELAGACRFLHDRRWYTYHQRPKIAASVLRLIDRGAFAGQCNIVVLPERDPAKLVSLAEFQEDVRRALGNSFGEFLEARQTVDGSNHRVLRVVVDGKSSDLPIRWIYYHIADPRGRQAALTFTIEQKLFEKFADADRPIVDSIEFLESKPAQRP